MGRAKRERQARREAEARTVNLAGYIHRIIDEHFWIENANRTPERIAHLEALKAENERLAAAQAGPMVMSTGNSEQITTDTPGNFDPSQFPYDPSLGTFDGICH